MQRTPSGLRTVLLKCWIIKIFISSEIGLTEFSYTYKNVSSLAGITATFKIREV